MDESVLRAMRKWPHVPAVYGWLALDRRGNWRIRDEKIGNAALRDFIGRNYQADARGRWFFQNGPQRVFVRLEYTPLVLRLDGAAVRDHCGRAFAPTATFLDDRGAVLMSGGGSVGLLDDRDLQAFAGAMGEAVAKLPKIPSSAVPARFAFDPDPKP